MDASQTLLSSGLQRRTLQRLCIFKLLLSLYIRLVLEQLYDEQEKIL